MKIGRTWAESWWNLPEISKLAIDIGKIWENHYHLVGLWKKHSIGKIFDKVQAAEAATLFWPGQLSSGPSRVSEIFKSQAPDVGRLEEKQYHYVSFGY